ncbi:short-chain dehydrogenase [Xylariales sp. AK1849]|nr:short-chain dehydrogenase [Xylariales sp. AK1849]
MSVYNKYTEGLTLVHDFADQVTGRTFLLTGPSTGGIGAETVISLAHESPAMIVLVGRSIDKAQATIDSINQVDPNIKVKFVEADLASLKSSREAAQTILEDTEVTRVDVLVNNAGVMACPYQVTEDGLESQLAANHLGHFVLANTIMPKILAAGAGARLVLISSSVHRYSPVNFQDPNWANPGSYGEFAAYGSSKSAMILYAVALSKRLASRGIHGYALHPGSISTGLQDHMKALGPNAAEILDDVSWRVNGKSLAAHRAIDKGKTLRQGCATTLRAALDPNLVNEEGVFLNDCNLTTDNRIVKEWATDPELAERCWRMSEELVGEQFSF